VVTCLEIARDQPAPMHKDENVLQAGGRQALVDQATFPSPGLQPRAR
jgi:hypothetical protein